MIPNDIFEWNLSNSEMMVFIYLIRCMDQKTRTCYPSYDKICKACKVTRATAINSIKKLVKLNLIKILEKGYKSEYGINKANTYKINEIIDEKSNH